MAIRDIFRVLRDNVGVRLTTKEIQRTLKEDYDKRLSLSSIRDNIDGAKGHSEDIKVKKRYNDGNMELVIWMQDNT